MNGTIRKRGKSSWQVIFDLPRGADGRRKQARHTVHGNKRDAEAKLRELLAASDKGEYVSSTKEIVGENLERWLNTYAATNTSPRTQRDYRGIVNRYLLPSLGPIPLTNLRPEHVDGLYAKMLGQGLAARTVLHTHRLLSEALSHAVRRRLVARNICDAVDPPRPRQKDMSALDSDEAVRFLTAADSSLYRDVFFVALYTGLRRSVVLALRWPSVDLDALTINVVAGLHRLTGRGLVMLPTKTDKSRRQIAITPEVGGPTPSDQGCSDTATNATGWHLAGCWVCIHQTRWHPFGPGKGYQGFCKGG